MPEHSTSFWFGVETSKLSDHVQRRFAQQYVKYPARLTLQKGLQALWVLGLGFRVWGLGFRV